MPPSEIYLVRHAIAAERGDDWPDDTKRPLTEEGISRFKEAVGGLKALDATIEEIFTRPPVPARPRAAPREAPPPRRPPPPRPPRPPPPAAAAAPRRGCSPTPPRRPPRQRR